MPTAPHPCVQDDVASCFAYYADLAEKLDKRQWEPVELGEEGFRSAIRREPLGVVVRIFLARGAQQPVVGRLLGVCGLLCPACCFNHIIAVAAVTLCKCHAAGCCDPVELPNAHGGERSMLACVLELRTIM